MADASVTLKVTSNTAALYYLLDPSASVDNIYSFLDQDGRKIAIVNSKGPYLLRAGGVLPGSNMLSRIQTIINDSRVSSIVFDYGDITVSGTLNCNGKKLTFLNGSKIIGTNTINAGIVDCPLSDQCFTTSTTLINFKSTQNEFSCENFGALGAGADETVILQKTSDTLIANIGMPRTIKMFSGKIYSTTGWIWHNWNGTDYSQYTLSLIGEPSTFGGNPSFTATLNCLNLNGFGLNVQRATGFTIKGINFTGQLVIPGVSDYGEFFSRPYSTFASTAGARVSRYSPNCLLGIDLFRNAAGLPPDNGYPGYNGLASSFNWYRGTIGSSSSGSTGGLMEDLSFSGAAVCVAVGINGQSQQCENMVWKNIYANITQCVFAFGQRESKDCFVYSGYSIDRVYNIVDTSTWGIGQGSSPYFKGWTCSGTVVQFCNISTQHSVTFESIYTETNYRIGDVAANAGMVKFSGCTWTMLTLGTIVAPPTHFAGANVLMESCTMRYYDDLFNKRFVLQGIGNQYRGCFFDAPPILSVGFDHPGSQHMSTSVFENCCYGAANANFGFSTLKGNIGSRNDYPIASGRIIEESANPVYGGSVKRVFDCGSHDGLGTVFSSSSYTVNTTTRTAVFNGGYSAGLLVGQYILYYTAGTFQVLGRISAINRSTNDISLVDIPIGIPNGAGSSAPWGISDFNRFRTRFTGIYTFNSPTITNIFGTPPVGELDLHVGAAILSYNAGAGTALMAGPAVNTASTSGELYSGAVPFGKESITYIYTGLPTSSGFVATNSFLQNNLFFPGDKWIATPGYYGFGNENTDHGIRNFVCIRSGYLFPGSIGQTKQSLWIETFEGEFKQLATGTSDFSVSIPQGRMIFGWKLLATVPMTVSVGRTNAAGDIDPGTPILANVSEIVDNKIFADTDTIIYFNGITGAGGSLIINFF